MQKIFCRCSVGEDGFAGQVLIINNSFEESPEWARRGSSIDSDNIKHCFKNLGFKLFGNTVHSGVCRRQLLNLVEDFAENVDHRSYECSAIIVMSHGHDDAIFLLDKSILQITKLLTRFCSKNLAGKLKLLILNACR